MQRLGRFLMLGMVFLAVTACVVVVFSMRAGVAFDVEENMDRVEDARLVFSTDAQELDIHAREGGLDVRGRRGLVPVTVSRRSPAEHSTDLDLSGLDGPLAYKGTAAQSIGLGDKVSWEAEIYSSARRATIKTGALNKTNVYLVCSQPVSLEVDTRGMSRDHDFGVDLFAATAVIYLCCDKAQRIVIFDETGRASIEGVAEVVRGPVPPVDSDPWGGEGVFTLDLVNDRSVDTRVIVERN